MSRRVTLRVQPPNPFGDVTIMPSPLSGRPEADMARAMAAALADVEAPTAAEVYNRLRQAFWRFPGQWTGCAPSVTPCALKPKQRVGRSRGV